MATTTISAEDLHPGDRIPGERTTWRVTYVRRTPERLVAGLTAPDGSTSERAFAYEDDVDIESQ